MPNEMRELRTGHLPFAWPTNDRADDVLSAAGWWLSGGAALVVWTAIALLLTSS